MKNCNSTTGNRTARYTTVDSTFGLFALIEMPDKSIHSQWVDQSKLPEYLQFDADLLPEVVVLLNRYFVGETDVDFSCVPTPNGPPFFYKCWEACRAIPIGTTVSYTKLAEVAGSPGAIRATGQAMRRNPLPLITPCHRVISASGDLCGFSGSTDPIGPQLCLKSALLQHENAMLSA